MNASLGAPCVVEGVLELQLKKIWFPLPSLIGRVIGDSYLHPIHFTFSPTALEK
jgi:hypothetical protein